ncbi:putative disease resistance protein RGA3 [Durio zibethinus]|uniref:Disease resistance protein RGA3 n=1 Tax=Durio zibethinus TaxID=66656 RepID=A0A6P5YTD2_DURZI|nr:putative disease resistance protein RGA3 [Durio zibethinus]
MAEAIVSTILEQLTALTIDKASEAWRLVRGVKKEVKRLESNFKAIQYEIEDAEEKQYVDRSLKHWLERFKQVSYDMEDVLDDSKTAVEELQKADHGVETSTTSVPKWMARPFVSCFSFGSKVVRRHDIATRIKDINGELDQIVKTKISLNW